MGMHSHNVKLTFDDSQTLIGIITVTTVQTAEGTAYAIGQQPVGTGVDMSKLRAALRFYCDMSEIDQL